MMDNPTPYLSTVATARNDDHGGNLMRRLQTFVNALVGQAKRHGVSMELVLVEWNPPADRPRLTEALEWPADLGSCTIRIIEVPAELHRRYKHSEALPLYQMIAKNVGIRRARGQFVLSTNIDIIFSDEFFQFLSEGRLERGKMYRVDRYDVGSDVPVDAPVDEQLAYCKSHLLRVNSRNGTFGLTPEGLPTRPVGDTAVQKSGVFFGRGWLPVERYFGQLFRWAENNAEVIVQLPGEHAHTLTFDLEPGPGVGFKPFVLQVLDGSGELLGETKIRRRSLIQLQLPFAGQKYVFRFRVIGGGRRAARDPRILNFRVFECAWEKSRVVSDVSAEGPALISVRAKTVSIWRRLVGLGPKALNFFTQAVRLLSVLRGAKEPLRVGLPISPHLVEKLRLDVGASGVSMGIGPREPWLDAPRLGAAEALTEIPESAVRTLHTNGCGDFTLLARDHWLELRGYPEFDLFSMHIDSVLCCAAHYGGAREEILVDPIRIYHIEHATGSGWTPEGQAALFERIAAKGLSWIDYSEVVGWAAQMQRLGTPMIFNRENWGLADFDLPETVLNP